MPLHTSQDSSSFQVFPPIFEVQRDVSGITSQLVLISAFFDARPVLFNKQPHILIAAISRLGNESMLSQAHCRFNYAQGSQQKAKLSFKVPNEHLNLLFHTTLIYCDLAESFSRARDACHFEQMIPNQVAVFHDEFFQPLVFKNISVTRPMLSLLFTKRIDSLGNMHSSYARNTSNCFSSQAEKESPLSFWSPNSIAICTAPLRRDGYRDVVPHFLEYYRTMGVSKVYAYISPPLRKRFRDQLQYYEAQDFVETIPWVLPRCKELDNHTMHGSLLYCDYYTVFVHAFAQTAAIADCIMRTAGQSRWTLLLDYDEFLSPQHSNDLLPRMLSRMFSNLNDSEIRSDQLAGAHFFTYMYSECGDLEKEYSRFSVNKSSSILISAFLSRYREKVPDGFGFRSKYLISPLHIDEMGVHFPYHSFSDSGSTALKEINLKWWKLFQRKNTRRKRSHPAIAFLKDQVVLVHPDFAHIHHIRFPQRFECQNKIFDDCQSSLQNHSEQVVSRLRAGIFKSSFVAP
jgi:hypothetical protein